MLTVIEFGMRKKEIQGLRTSVEIEINSNISFYNKMKGTPVLFGNSTFQLVHLASMKYLSLHREGEDEH